MPRRDVHMRACACVHLQMQRNARKYAFVYFLWVGGANITKVPCASTLYRCCASGGRSAGEGSVAVGASALIHAVPALISVLIHALI